MTQQRRPRAYERDRAAKLSPDSPPRTCEWPDCDAAGDYPAPRSRDRLRDYTWFCLDHIREYNRKWDYFAEMDADTIDRHRRDDVTWHRPSWRFGTQACGTEDTIKMGPNGPWRFRDPFKVLGDEDDARPPPPSRPGGRAEEMLGVMHLSWGFTLDELKQRYKALAKRHHPDLHGGDKRQEERLKRINEAYSYLKNILLEA